MRIINVYRNIIFVCLCFLGAGFHALAQQDESNKADVQILHANLLMGLQTDSGSVMKLLGDAALEHDGTTMYCDSAYLNQTTNNLEAFGNVQIIQPSGTQVQSDYLRYTGSTKMAFLQGNVSLTNGSDNLWTEELEYNTGTKIGDYYNGGTLQSETTTLTSLTGNYNARTKDARFKNEVFVTDPQYQIISEDLGYNSETKVVRFFGPSKVTSEESILHTSNGIYDSKNKTAHFTDRSSVFSDGQYVEADTMHYWELTGYGHAIGNVVAIDTARKLTLYSGDARYNQKENTMLASIKPVMKVVTDNDSLYIRADTFFSAPMSRLESKKIQGENKIASDTTVKKQVKNIKKREAKHSSQRDSTSVRDTVTGPLLRDSLMRQREEALTGANDTLAADSTGPRYFTGYHNVLIFSDSLQGKCDSIVYLQTDSVLKMIYDPIAWTGKSQITGDTILLYMDSSRIKKMYVPNNAFMVSLAGPEKAEMYDQIQGKTITGNFENNTITDMIVRPNAETIYYPKDDDGAYIGVNEVQGERMHILFEDEAISRIIFEQDVKQTMTPLTEANIPAMRLARFQWLPELRPKSIEELFE